MMSIMLRFMGYVLHKYTLNLQKQLQRRYFFEYFPFRSTFVKAANRVNHTGSPGHAPKLYGTDHQHAKPTHQTVSPAG